LESTISGVAYVRLLGDAQRRGYVVKLFYLWLSSAELAVRRVRERVRKGLMMCPLRTCVADLNAASRTSLDITCRSRTSGAFWTIAARLRISSLKERALEPE
jgi:hypothetical protein